LADLARRFSIRRLLRPDPFGPGLFSPAPLAALATELIGAQRFEQLRTPLTVTCTDLQRGVSVRYSEGPLIPPVVGSCLAAGVFSPVTYDGRHLVDGGYSDPVPVAAASPGSVVVAVDPSAIPDWPVDVDPPRAWRHVAKGGRVARQIRKSADTLIYALGRERLRHRDHVLVVPNLGAMTFVDFGLGDWAIERGYEAMRQALPEIRDRLIAPWSPETGVR
jgi:predicted acylesterase/phospholipase RssA